jgi:GNAT superfamily N-acetyltransferase
MKLHYAHLSRWHYPQIFNTFMEAFADYAVSMSDSWLMNVSVRPSHRRHGIATALLQRVVASLPPDVEALKLINVERSDTGMLSWAGAMGFESYARQFEMALTVSARGRV